ncbi:MAG: OmpA family protein [Pseudomonadota bacterium]
MSDASTGVDRLRQLLFDKETELIETVDQRVERLKDRVDAVEVETASEKRERLNALRRIDALFERTGTEERLKTSVARIIDEAIVEAEEVKQPQLSRAVAPLVIETIKTELRNSQDEMVEALYPITGRLVQAYVKSAMRDLSDQINRRLEQNAVMLRIRSWTTGTPVSDLALADTQRLQVEELFLIRRGSGELLARWPKGQTLSNSDTHMSGLLTAITGFAGEAFGDEGGDLRNFEADGFRVFLRASPSYLLAAKCSGHAPVSVASILDDEFLKLLESKPFREGIPESGSSAAAGELSAVADDVSTKIDETYDALQTAGTGYGFFKALLFVVAVPLIAWVLWSLYSDLRESHVRRLAQEQIDQTIALKGYTTTVVVGARGESVKVTGLTPTDDARRDLIRRLRGALPQTTSLDTELAVLPKVEPSPDARPLVAQLSRQLASVEGDLRRSGLLQVISRSETRLRQALGDATALNGELEDRARKAQMAEAERSGQSALQALSQVRERIEALPATAAGEDFSRLTQPLREASRRMAEATAKLPTAQEGSSAQQQTPPIVTVGEAATPGAIAEEMSAQVERFAGTVVALREVSRIKPAPPQTIVRQVPVRPSVTPEQLLSRWVRRNAIFFSNGTDFRDPELAVRQLNELAERIKRAQMLVRIVGFTDERGGLNRNNALARARARAVLDELADRDVPRQFMAIVGRANGRELSAVVGENSPNRRVEFELGFIGEAGGRQ